MEMPQRRLADMRGRTALVTGASSGIGLAIARRLIEAGASVHGVARRPMTIDDLGLEAAPAGDVTFHQADVADRAAAHQLVSQMVGEVDTVVCAAGTNVPNRHTDQWTVDSWDTVLDTNLDGIFNIVQPLLPQLRRTQGDVVIIGSVSSQWPDHTGPAYQAAKAGALGLARGLALDEHRHGVRFSTISPGIVNTAILDRRPEPPPQALREMFVQPEDVAEAVLAAITLPQRTNIAEMTIVATYLQAVGKTYAATPDHHDLLGS